jgi:hypothetical protein
MLHVAREAITNRLRIEVGKRKTDMFSLGFYL